MQLKRKLLTFIASLSTFFFLFNYSAYAGVIEENSLNMETGIAQISGGKTFGVTNQYTKYLPSSDYVVGCAPLALGRAYAYFNPQSYSGPNKDDRLAQTFANMGVDSVSKYGWNGQTGDIGTANVDTSTPLEGINWIFDRLEHSGYQAEVFKYLGTSEIRSWDRWTAGIVYDFVRSSIDAGKVVFITSLAANPQHIVVVDGYRKVTPLFGNEDLYLHFLYGEGDGFFGVKDGEWIKIDDDKIGSRDDEDFIVATPDNPLFVFSLAKKPGTADLPYEALPDDTYRTGPYLDYQAESKKLWIPGVQSYDVHVTSDLGPGDTVDIHDANGKLISRVSGKTDKHLNVSGSFVTAMLWADGTVHAYTGVDGKLAFYGATVKVTAASTTTPTLNVDGAMGCVGYGTLMSFQNQPLTIASQNGQYVLSGQFDVKKYASDTKPTYRTKLDITYDPSTQGLATNMDLAMLTDPNNPFRHDDCDGTWDTTQNRFSVPRCKQTYYGNGKNACDLWFNLNVSQ